MCLDSYNGLLCYDHYFVYEKCGLLTLTTQTSEFDKMNYSVKIAAKKRIPLNRYINQKCVCIT